MMASTIDELVKKYGLQPHPEGGYFVEWYGSNDMISTDLNASRYAPGSSRRLATAILYMCVTGGHSSLHKITGDELWMFHSGDPLTVVELSAGQGGDAVVKETVLGNGVGETLVHTVKATTYFGAHCSEAGAAGYSLVTCVVAPGFDYRDWAMEGPEALLAAFPGARAATVIEKLAHR
jgi:predicted cupin superfamily sugar epimerase